MSQSQRRNSSMQPTKISQGSLQTPSSRFPRALERPLRPKVQRSPRSQSSLAPPRRQSVSAPHGPPGGTGTVVGSDIGHNIGNPGNMDDPACGVAWMNARAASAEKSGSGICSAAGWPADGDHGTPLVAPKGVGSWCLVFHHLPSGKLT